MAIRPILTYPDKRLSQESAPVKEVNDEVRALLDDMVETMYSAPGIGLAAIQVGVPLRVVVMDLNDEEEGYGLLELINPEIVGREGETVFEEGCLSVPGVAEDIKRSRRVVVHALDRRGEPFELEAEELLAVCCQHELDHLEGVLFIERLSRLKRKLAMRNYDPDAPAQEGAAAL